LTKLTAGASALVVASKVVIATDEEYGREAGHEFDVCFYHAAGDFLRSFRWPLPVPATVAAEFAAQTDLLRCIAGNPFRPVAADPAWLTSAVVGLAAAIYADRAFDRLPILADALEDAGCDHPDILAHCRSHPEHARGCWVVDLVLCKS
jgi:hypothetical protein